HRPGGPGGGGRRPAPDRQPSRRRNPPDGGTAVRLILAEDSVLLREGLSRLLIEAGFDVVATAGDAEEALRLVEECKPDVAVLDIRMRPSRTHEALQAAPETRPAHPELGVPVLSPYVDTGYAARRMNYG